MSDNPTPRHCDCGAGDDAYLARHADKCALGPLRSAPRLSEDEIQRVWRDIVNVTPVGFDQAQKVLAILRALNEEKKA